MLDYRNVSASFVAPKALHVFEHRNNLFMGELIAECWHSTFELGDVWAFPNLSSLTHRTIKEAVAVVPRVAVTVEGWGRERAIFTADVPIWLAFTLCPVTRGARRREDLLSGTGALGGGVGKTISIRRR